MRNLVCSSIIWTHIGLSCWKHCRICAWLGSIEASGCSAERMMQVKVDDQTRDKLITMLSDHISKWWVLWDFPTLFRSRIVAMGIDKAAIKLMSTALIISYHQNAWSILINYQNEAINANHTIISLISIRFAKSTNEWFNDRWRHLDDRAINVNNYLVRGALGLEHFAGYCARRRHCSRHCVTRFWKCRGGPSPKPGNRASNSSKATSSLS